MSDQRLRDLERAYEQEPTRENLVRLLEERAKCEPLPCPSCGRRLHAAVERHVTVEQTVGGIFVQPPDAFPCPWCGALFHPAPATYARRKLRLLEKKYVIHREPVLQEGPRDVRVIRRRAHDLHGAGQAGLCGSLRVVRDQDLEAMIRDRWGGGEYTVSDSYTANERSSVRLLVTGPSLPIEPF